MTDSHESIKRTTATFALLTYNQESFIEEAVGSALGQTYSPLQIIISDDCSEDRTYELIRKLVDSYNGPHQILLNRNPINLGLGDHINRVMRMATGEIIVAAAGDDVSSPHRVSQIVEYLASHNPNIHAVCSAVRVVDDHGIRVGSMTGVKQVNPIDALTGSERWIIGCSQAWKRSLFEKFGPIPPGTIAEDKVIAFRALLLGQIGFIESELVSYRQHQRSITASHSHVTRSLQVLSTLKGHLHDLAMMRKGRIDSPANLEHLEETLNSLLRENELYLAAARTGLGGLLALWIKNAGSLVPRKMIKLLAGKFLQR